jgi:hypothetical protein
MTTLRHLAAALLLAGSLTAVHAQSLRPEVGKPLQQASDLLRAGKAKEALAKVNEADRAGNKTPAETLMIERMRGAAAQRAGDNATAAKAFEAAFATGKLSAAEQTQMAESLAFTYSQLKDNAKASQWVQKAQALGNNSAQLKQLAAYLAAGGDYNAIAKSAAAAVAAAEQAGKKPEEGDLLRLADAYQRTNNAAGNTRRWRSWSPTTRRRITGPRCWAASSASRLLRPLRHRRAAPEAGHRQPHQRRRLHGTGPAGPAGGLCPRARPWWTRAWPPACWAWAPRPPATSACWTWP